MHRGMVVSTVEGAGYRFFLQVNGVMFQCIHKIQFTISCRHFGKYKVKPGKVKHFQSTLGKSGSSRKTTGPGFHFSSVISNSTKEKINLPHHYCHFY